MTTLVLPPVAQVEPVEWAVLVGRILDHADSVEQRTKDNAALCASLATQQATAPIAQATQPAAPIEQAAQGDPMDWPLPCDVTVGHGTLRKGVKLSVLVARMKVLYEMATGSNADDVAARTLPERINLATLQIGGICQKHLAMIPCQKCADGVPAPFISSLIAATVGPSGGQGEPS